ncbi:lysophospholipid acyltransferase family protein [Nocardioides terrisoli]|uniref:lysophospholipid acyltransferase family protein n=1 Tax=Nocardioides terrisoli TaxID=3388267 RepID=UPI00287BA855|nr:lysophospholipid acyltransferase family protein [Nocardioides marmorisolisilvae]
MSVSLPGEMFPGSATDLPRTDGVQHPATSLLYRGRPTAARLVRRHFRVEERGRERVPMDGPVIMVANHVGFIDGPLMAILAPRPVHSLTKVEMFSGPMGRFLRASGQIPVRRHEPDIRAVRVSLKVLRAGGVVGVFPEGSRGGGECKRAEPGAAYLAIASGAPVVPVIYLGTRLPGSRLSSIPPRGSRVAMTYGEPLIFPAHGWPRRRGEVREITEQIRNALLDTRRCAEDATGMSLPGPAPDGEVEE